MNETSRNIKEIIEKIGNKNIEFWSQALRTLQPQEVGVIKAGGRILEQLEQLCAETAYLAREQQFYMPLLIGESAEYNKLSGYLESRGSNFTTISKQLRDKIKLLATTNQERTAEKLEKRGVKTQIIPPETTFVRPIDQEWQNYAATVVSVDTKPIIKAIHENKIPIITHLGTSNKEIFVTDATQLATQLVKYLKAKKIVIVGDTPILDKNQNLVRTIFSEQEFDQLVRDGTITGEMITSGKHAYNLLNYLGPGHSVQLTNPDYLVKTIRTTGLLEEILGNGSGTKLTVPSVITTYPIETVSQEDLRTLINTAFEPQNKKLKQDYFRKIKKKDPTVYLDSIKKGGAITYPIQDCEYMCKLFTHPTYEGMGIATSIVETILQQKGPVAWRTSITNQSAICHYNKLAKHFKGFAQKEQNYMIYGIGIPPEKQEQTIKQIMQIEKTFLT